jgi:hypothetical protein
MTVSGIDFREKRLTIGCSPRRVTGGSEGETEKDGGGHRHNGKARYVLVLETIVLDVVDAEIAVTSVPSDATPNIPEPNQSCRFR